MRQLPKPKAYAGIDLLLAWTTEYRSLTVDSEARKHATIHNLPAYLTMTTRPTHTPSVSICIDVSTISDGRWVRTLPCMGSECLHSVPPPHKNGGAPHYFHPATSPATGVHVINGFVANLVWKPRSCRLLHFGTVTAATSHEIPISQNIAKLSYCAVLGHLTHSSHIQILVHRAAKRGMAPVN